MIVNRYILISKKVTRRTIYAKTKKLVFYLVDVTRKEEYSKDWKAALFYSVAAEPAAARYTAVAAAATLVLFNEILHVVFWAPRRR